MGLCRSYCGIILMFSAFVSRWSAVWASRAEYVILMRQFDILKSVFYDN